jgi:hypothetical protein
VKPRPNTTYRPMSTPSPPSALRRFRLSLVLGLAALVLGVAFRSSGTGSDESKQVYISSRNWVPRDVIQTTQAVYRPPNPKCDSGVQELAQTVVEMSGAAIVPSLPKDGIVLVITFNCGLRRSTLYHLPATFEMLVNFCDPANGPTCLARTVFGFSHPLGEKDWECAREIIRQELLNDRQRDVKRFLGPNCDRNSDG